MSSIAAYGMTPDVPDVVNEETPLRGSQTKAFYYAYTKGIVEENLDIFEREHPEICITRFRPHIITGPHFLSRTTNLEIFLGPLRAGKTAWVFKPQNSDRIILQLSHEDDVAAAVSLAVRQDMPGAFNIASSPLDLFAYIRQRGIRIRFISLRLAAIGLSIGGIFSKRARLERAWLESMRYVFTMTCDKILAQGFSFQHPTTEECIEEALHFTPDASAVQHRVKTL